MNGNTCLHSQEQKNGPPGGGIFSRWALCFLLTALIVLPAIGCGKPKEISPQEKIESLKSQVADKPDDPDAHYHLGVMYLIVKNYADAVNQFKDAVRLNKEHAHAYRDLAVAYYHSNQPEESEKWLKKAYGLNTKDPTPLTSLGGLSVSLGHNVAALKYLNTALTKEDDHLNTHINLGAAYINMGQIDKGLNQLQSALEIDGNSAPTHNNLGVYYDKVKQRDKALEEFNKAIQSDPRYPMPHYNLGSIYAREKQYPQALAEWKKVIELEPKDSHAHAAMGWTYIKLKNPKEAMKAYTRALQINPSDALTLGGIGKLYLEEGRVDEAIDALEKAVNLKLDYGDAYYTLGIAYDASHDGTKAIINMNAAQKVYAFKKNSSMLENSKNNLKLFYAKYKLNPKDFAGIAMPAILQEPVKPPPKKKKSPANAQE